MPSVLENLVDELGDGLDDKARRSLSDVDPVSAVAFLQRLHSRAEQGEVRNPSAFVATAVRTALARGMGPGPSELESALQQLKQNGTLDDSALEVLHKVSPDDACAAVASYLGQDASAVRNASAYVTRNAMNARRNPSPMMHGGAKGGYSPGYGGGCGYGGGPGYGCGPGFGSPDFGPGPGYGSPRGYSQPSMHSQAFSQSSRPSVSQLMAKWGTELDKKAKDALVALGPHATADILSEMEAKQTSIRNPSAYVQRACENWKDGMGIGPSGIGPPDMPMMFAGPQGPPIHSALYMRYQEMLDMNALDALTKVSSQQVNIILQNLDSRSASVRNPSAYVVRSVANILDGDPGLSRGIQSVLDDTAKAALAGVSQEVADSITQEVTEKMGSIKNPSAYVQRAVINARRGEAAGGTEDDGEIDGLPLQMAPKEEDNSGIMAERLDEGARQALAEIGTEAADAIICVLEAQGSKIHNPSAYVLKAVGNARRGKGAGGAVVQSGAGFSEVDSTREWQAGGLRESSDEKGAVDDFLQVQEEISKLPFTLDGKAMEALDEVGNTAAISILQKLNKQANQVNNPNAYIMRAVGNEKRGVGSNGPSPALKRSRFS